MHPQTDNYRLVSHGGFGVQHQIQVGFVGSGTHFAPVAPIGEVLPEVPSGNAHFPGVVRHIGTVLQGYGHIAIAALVRVLLGVSIGQRAFDEHEGEIRFFRSVRPLVIFFHQAFVCWDNLPFGIHATEEVFPSFDFSLGDVHLFALRDGQNLLIFHQHHGLKLSLVARLGQLLAAYDSLALFRIQVGIFKKTAPEDVLQQACS